MTVFEVGKYYEADDPGFGQVKVVKRTEKSVFVKFSKRGESHRKEIKVDPMGSEYFYSDRMEYNSRWGADDGWCYE